MTVNRGTDLRTELAKTLKAVNVQIEEVETRARSLGITPYVMTDANGTYVLIPLLAAKAQCLHSLVLLNQGKS